MLIAVPNETVDGEQRVALTPDAVSRLVKDGHKVRIETCAGALAGWTDADYSGAGAEVASNANDVFDGADVVFMVNRPTEMPGGASHVEMIPEGAVLIGMLAPLSDESGIKRIAERGITAFSMEMVPRISRAQSMDALSSMSTVAGYKATLIAADRLDKFFPMLMTAAGTVAPARVFVLGAGVAGLQAIASARRLGAVVSAFDTRAVVKEQVESLGATFVELDVAGDAEASGGYARELTPEEQDKQRKMVADHIAKSDVVITTALVPGRPAPLLIPTSTVERMRTGAVIVDLAAETGGNCELTKYGEEIVHTNGVRIVGPKNLPATMPLHASQLYSKNLTNLFALLVKDQEINVDLEDEIIAGSLVTNMGAVVHPMLIERYGSMTTPAATVGSSNDSEGGVRDDR